MKIELQPAYILHTRPFRDTSLLVDFFTQNHGRITAVAKGARNPKKHQRQLLQPFQAVTVSWQGNSELKTLIGIELSSASFSLSGQFLYSALYANELLSYLLAQGDAAEEVYVLYSQLLQTLEQKQALEPTLREFEFALLSALGYEINFVSDAHHGQSINPDAQYAYIHEQGFVASDECPEGVLATYPGTHLIAIAKAQYADQQTRQVAKQIARAAISTLLQGKKIKSRELFSSTMTNDQK